MSRQRIERSRDFTVTVLKRYYVRSRRLVTAKQAADAVAREHYKAWVVDVEPIPGEPALHHVVPSHHYFVLIGEDWNRRPQRYDVALSKRELDTIRRTLAHYFADPNAPKIAVPLAGQDSAQKQFDEQADLLSRLQYVIVSPDDGD